MNILSELHGITSIKEALVILLRAENALDYNKKGLMAQFTSGVSEIEALGSRLCGMNGHLVEDCIKQGIVSNFLSNISFNGEDSIPLVVRVLHLTIQYQHQLERDAELKQASVEV